jgi:unsaturated chondroitin disaccharide hydrolase
VLTASRPYAVLVTVATVMAAAAVSRPAGAADDLSRATIERAFTVASGHLADTTATLTPGQYPVRSDDAGTWVTGDASGWTSGFLSGALWFMYERTGEEAWRERAEAWQAGLEAQKDNTSTHDIGFMLFDSFGHGYRLTGDEAYRQILLTAAGSLAVRYSPAVGSVRSWGRLTSPTFTVIIDNMMNLELLFWAARNGGDPAWRDMAVSHALNSARDHVRPDGSTYHVVEYSSKTGALKRRGTHQGYSDTSTWSRGQAWAVYGFTMAYRETGDARFLDTARRTAGYFLAHLPDDHVPYWDFDLPSLVGEPRDSSAAAIAASGLLELARLEPDRRSSDRYQDAAASMLASLSSPSYLASGPPRGAILLHGTQNKPDGNFDTGLIFGDYFFLEALLRYTAR